MKVLITGGHLSPALSVINKLKNDQIFYAGRKYALEGDKAYSFEYITINNLNIPFFEINTGRLQRKLTKHTFPSLLKLPIGFYQSILLLKKIKPDVVLGFGGYVSAPLIISANFLKIPTVIHEQTLEAGFANKILAKFATKICISWETSFDYFPKSKTVLTGLPIRSDILNIKKNKNINPLLYITGGSLGSHKINKLTENSIARLLKDFTVIHQTGDSRVYNDFKRLSDLRDSLSSDFSGRYSLFKFLSPSESASAIANADIVVSRSGINTVAELIYLNKPALLIPIHFAQKNEQLKNALFMKDLGYAEVEDELTLTPDEFYNKIIFMKNNLDNYKKAKSDGVFDGNAAEKIINILKDVAKKINS